jgi:hypothetical protein
VRTAAQVKGEKSQADAKAKEREIKDKEREVWEALRRVEDEAAALLGVHFFGGGGSFFCGKR